MTFLLLDIIISSYLKSLKWTLNSYKNPLKQLDTQASKLLPNQEEQK